MVAARGLRVPCVLLLIPGLCVSFNIDVKRPQIFHGPSEAQFGYKVLQHEAGGQKWLLVGAPWEGTADDRRGDVYKCAMGSRNRSCSQVHLGDTALRNVSKQIKNMHFGMTLVDNKGEGFVACAPLWSQECGTSMFSTGICTKVDSDFRPTKTIAPTAQRCSTYMDIVIVLDGSNSIYPWYEVQNFLSNILSKFFIDPEQIQVGVLQYGEKAVHEWSLHDYQTAEEVVEAAKNISRQEGRETRTAFAIHTACTEAFSLEHGGREGATKLMIVVTDGESHDGDELPGALAECEKRNITRYAIAVLGHYIRRQQDPESFIREIKYIASDPDEKYFFNVTDEAALNDIVDALGDRIFSLEGTHGYNESSFELEMSQIGFSTHLLEDGILFGTVGAYDWDGAVLKESRHGRIVPPRQAFAKEFPLELKNHAAYLGYTVSSVRLRGGRRLYVAGAPRFQHKGKVILFEMSSRGSVAISQALTGEQIGSYFGSEVCPVDVNGDGVTDVLLVAAPMFLGEQSKETGRVYVYKVGPLLLMPNGTLEAERKPQDSRFGYALAALPDLNHDGFNDVAVGAPLEDGHRGAVYLYYGARGTVLPTYKQRIEASSFRPGLSYFGRSLDGQLDLDGDALVDLAVGAQGAAVVLRSRRIVQVAMALAVTPPSISVLHKSCQRSGKEAACLSAELCFQAASRAPKRGERHFGLRYNVTLDERRPGARAAFDDASQKRTVQRRLRAAVGRRVCQSHPFHVFDTTDYLRPVSLTVKFELLDAEGAPVLDESSPTTLRKLVPFFKDCGEDNECVTDLMLQASMDIAGSRQEPYIVRRGRRKVLVDATLENKQENAYNASLALAFSTNLHFSSLALKGDAPPKVECTAPAPHARVCAVSYPVFRALAKVAFILEFEFSCSSLLNRAQVKLVAGSDSLEANETLRDNTAELFAYVRYEPDLFLSSEAALTRYEVHLGSPFPNGIGPEFQTTVKVQNLGCYPVSGLALRMALPAAGYQSRPFLSITHILANNVTCSLQNVTAATAPLHPANLAHEDRLNCSNTWCQAVTCELAPLEKGAEVSVQLLRVIHNDFFRRAKFKAVKIVSMFALVAEERSVLVLDESVHRWETVLEIIQPKRIPVSLWILIGSIVGGLLLLALIIFCLWKLGFFAHKKPQEEEEKEEQ
ncbi:integrin alpha-10 [Alligator mississippiensis]|nr:integrin alpha-10 [Alligator mississippiensis]